MIDKGKYDIIILGGGCAGLSLAMQLARYGNSCPSIVILEQRSQYIRDRTWCFWDDGTSSFSSLVSHRWQKMAVAANRQALHLENGTFSYCMLAADTFYHQATTEILKNSALNIRLGSEVISKSLLPDRSWRVETREETFNSQIIIDTTQQTPAKRNGAILWQSFLGHEIICDDAIFDPSRVILMDFLEPNSRDVRFVYVLPLSPHRALVEATVFSPDPLTPDDLKDQADNALRSYTQQSSFKIERSEYGVLPMGMRLDDSKIQANYIKVGLSAGGARNCSGYAFQRIQTWAQSCARNIIEQGCALGHHHDGVIKLAMDKLFLHVLRADPQKAPELFFSLFKNADTQSVIRFLSDRASLIDYGRIIMALPASPFIRHFSKNY